MKITQIVISYSYPVDFYDSCRKFENYSDPDSRNSYFFDNLLLFKNSKKKLKHTKSEYSHSSCQGKYIGIILSLFGDKRTKM